MKRVKKTIFLFWLFLMIFGAVSVKAQVRIGGESAPDPSAVLDLNPGGTDNKPAGGFLLPQVQLESDTDRVFDVAPARGLVVYNVNEGRERRDFDRPREGIYRYNGIKWIAVSVDSGDEDWIEFIMESNADRLWLGVAGNYSAKTLEVRVTPRWVYPGTVTDIDTPAIKYKWTLSATGYPPVTRDTDLPELTLDSALLSSVSLHTVYNVALTARYHWTEKTQDIAIVAVGPGAWVEGGKRWLKVANTNLGATREDIPLNEQLNIVNGYNTLSSDSLGYFFQWARESHIVRSSSLTRMDPLPVQFVQVANGQPMAGWVDGDAVFIKGYANGDWRGYPSGYSSVNPPKGWTWNPGPELGEAPDPCRVIKKGKWRVLTREDWNDIFANNDVVPADPEIFTNNGITVKVKDALDAQGSRLAFFLPETMILNTEGEYEDQVGYWLNDNSDEGQAWAISSANVATQIKKAYGLNIRCVED
ncbi:MAG: hypothetical protein LBB73_02065 [Dysgonamonadaceae bacterium]|jgi:hypothetical protein|nr:hypothetical protein [Dysgonamonadaceae bacterium]